MVEVVYFSKEFIHFYQLFLQSAISVIMDVKWEVSEYLMQSEMVKEDGCC